MWRKRTLFDFLIELAKSLTYPLTEQQRMNGLRKSVIGKIDFVLNQQSTPPTVSKIEQRFPYWSYKRKCFVCIEKSNTKKEKDNASCSNDDCQSCGKSVYCKHALCICDYCNNNAN